MKETVEYWRAKYESVVADINPDAVLAAEQVVRSAYEMHLSLGVSFGTAHASIMKTLFDMGAARARGKRR